MPLHRVWEYRDIGRLFITAGGEEGDNRGAEVGLWVEVILRVSLEVILRKLLRQKACLEPVPDCARIVVITAGFFCVF